jgi:hypothetical protein
MKVLQIALTGVLALLVGVAPALAQSTTPGASSPSPSTSPNVGPSMPDDTKPGAATSPTPRAPGTAAPSASPSTTGSVPASKSDCSGEGWSKYTSQAFTNESECLSWLEKQGK